VKGIEAYPVEVEVNAGHGDTIIVSVGLPDAGRRDARRARRHTPRDVQRYLGRISGPRLDRQFWT
jgi:predicted ATPase with chaperone activity